MDKYQVVPDQCSLIPSTLGKKIQRICQFLAKECAQYWLITEKINPAQ